MIRSLRARLLVAMTAVLLAAVAAVALYSGIVVQREFGRYLRRVPPVPPRGLTAALLEAHARGSWPALEQVLTATCGEQRMQCLVLDPSDRVMAAYPASLRKGTVRRIAPRGIIIESPNDTLRLHGIDHPVGTIGTLYFFAGPGRLEQIQVSFRQSVRVWLLAGLAAALLVSFLVTATIFRRLFAPVEQLTSAVRQVAAGQRGVRIDERGKDEIAELARAFNGLTEALERNEQTRRNMVSDIAHELRTPLASMRCQIESAQDGVVPADTRLFAGLHEETLNLARLVDDLQQLSLAEAGQLRLDIEEVPLHEIVARAGDGPVDLDVPEDLVVRADAGRAVQILRNLVVNAITHAGTRVQISAAREGDFAVIRVRDDGPGIPAEHLDRIFDRFHRVDPSRSRSTGGAGLGLAIARELVHLHGGTIAARNRPGGGAEVEFTLPAVFIGSS